MSYVKIFGGLIDSIVDWIYSSDKFAELKQKAMDKGKSDAAATQELVEKQGRSLELTIILMNC